MTRECSISSVVDIPSVPGELSVKLQASFCSANPGDALFKALGVE